MSKELLYIRFIQIAISLSTLFFIYGIIQAKAGKIALHKKINGLTALVIYIGVVGLVITVFMGWDYQSLTTPIRMLIHRCFSAPLLILLSCTVYFGLKESRKWHLRFVCLTIPFWIGTLVTGILFF